MLIYLCEGECLFSEQYKRKNTVQTENLISLNQTGEVNSVNIQLLLSENCSSCL